MSEISLPELIDRWLIENKYHLVRAGTNSGNYWYQPPRNPMKVILEVDIVGNVWVKTSPFSGELAKRTRLDPTNPQFFTDLVGRLKTLEIPQTENKR